MPGTTRYSATFDRPYDEDEKAPAQLPPVVARRSRSHSLQVDSFGDRKHLFSLNGSQSGSHSRSSSTEKKAAEVIPTRTAGKTTVKPHNNPFQFVKVGTSSLYKKAEEQLKKVQEVKKPAVIKEDEEEWQNNLDSWKSRRRKMSEGCFRRQEELRLLEMQEKLQQQQQCQKKIKTFTEIVEERAHRGRALSLCLFSNPLESSEWVFENKRSRRTSHDPLHASEESAESSNINSEDDNDGYRKQIEDLSNKSESTDGLEHHHNGVQTSTSNSSISKNSDLSEFDASQESISHKDHGSGGGMYIDSGLESLSSSHRAGDIPDSGSDFSQDSASSVGCDSPRVSGILTTGVELLEEFSSNEELRKQSSINKKEKTPERLMNGDNTPKDNPNVLKQSSSTTPPAAVSEEKKQSKEKIKKVKSTKKPAGKKSTSKNDLVSKSENLGQGEGKDGQVLANCPEPVQVKSENSKATPKKTNKIESSENVISKKSGEKQLEQGSKHSESPLTNGVSSFSLIEQVPIDKVTEEMERLILQQLEQEELSKEMETNAKVIVGDIDVPSKRVEPPKEKPPPPPVDAAPSSQNSTSTKMTSVKRTNSTKRILKEIHKRRSDFLGIEEPQAMDVSHSGLSVQPPPALDYLLKAEQEESKKLQEALKNAAPPSPTTSEEDEEIARKEREIIENLEKEESLRMCQNENLVHNLASPEIEEERIKRLKEERKNNEEERLLVVEEQRIRLEEAKLLQKREQQIREQEAKGDSESKLNSCSNETMISNSSEIPAKDKVSLLSNGDGAGALPSSSSTTTTSLATVANELSKTKESNPPPTAPKPLKKKEAIRKERERLRYEQEILQREREEHRRKIQMEQEQTKKNQQKSHVPGTPVCQVELPPSTTAIKKPSLPSQLTSQMHHTSHKEAPAQAIPTVNQNGYGKGVATGSYPQPQPRTSSVQHKQSVDSAPRSKNAPEVRTKPKVPLVRKQPEPSGESRYNQNHWLIQEAEMRRIAEQKERQRSQSHNDLRLTNPSHHPTLYSDSHPNAVKPVQRPSALSVAQNSTNYAAVPMQYSPDKSWNCAPLMHQNIQSRKGLSQSAQHMNFDSNHPNVVFSSNYDLSKSPPAKPSRGALLEKQQEQMLSVSGRKRCSHCGEELGRGAAMIIESLQLYYHIQCFKCCVCHAQLGNGSCGTDVRVRSNKLHCHNCYSNDEAGLKFSQV